MKKRILSSVMVLVMMVSLLCYSPYEVEAKELKPVDLVLVLDQSGSMKSNDPNGMMREAACKLIEMMPSKISRVGVISFNRKQTRVAELTELSTYDSVSSLIANVNAIPYKGDTDIGNAVADAVEMFDKNDGRQHAILVLSDGRNDFGLDKNAEQKSDERLYNALIDAKSQDCMIFCLGFGKEMSNVNDTPYQKLASIATSEKTISTETEPEKIHEFFVYMLGMLTGGEPIPMHDNKVTIKQNVKEANIYMSSPVDLSGVTIELLGPDGDSIVLQNNENAWFYKGKYSAVIKLFSPQPGVYTVQTSTDQIEISLGYIPFYEYVLSSGVVDSFGNKVEKIDNGTTAEIQTTIQQDGKDITSLEEYDSVKAVATVTAKATGETKNVELTHKDGKLTGNITFDHLATYEITIVVESDSYKLDDHLQIETSQRAVTFTQGNGSGLISNKVIDKTFKKSSELLVKRDELLSIVNNPDKVSVELETVSSSETAKVIARITDDGVLLTGLKWGSSIVSVSYKDGLGNKIETSFVVKVQDKLMVALFAALPVFIGLMIALIVYLVMRKSRMIKGEFEMRQITIFEPEGNVSVINTRRTYQGGYFVGRKKTFGNGVAQYARDVYSMDSSSSQNVMLYEMFAHNQTEMQKNLDEIEMIGTYLGTRGCTVRTKRGAKVSIGAKERYERNVKLSWSIKNTFKVYTKDSRGVEICVEGCYDPQIRKSKGIKTKKPSTTATQTRTTQSSGGFDNFFN